MDKNCKMLDDIFVLSDIHGQASELKLLLNKLPIQKNTCFIFLGDYIDRGPDSKEVIDIIINLKKSHSVVTLMGNHESMFISFLEDPESSDSGSFIFNGGGATLASYQSEAQDGTYLIPHEHIAFFNNLSLYFEHKDYFFVHAGLPDVSIRELDNERDRHDLLWIRRSFFNSDFVWEKHIIHGHTPGRDVVVNEKRTCIDTGCCFDNKLSALHLSNKKIYSISRLDSPKHIYLRDFSSQRRAIRFSGTVPVYIELEDDLLQFETINYSEFGMLIINIIETINPVFNSGQIISGTIGSTEGIELICFEGEVVRVLDENSILSYAINFTKRPYEFVDNIKED